MPETAEKKKRTRAKAVYLVESQRKVTGDIKDEALPGTKGWFPCGGNLFDDSRAAENWLKVNAKDGETYRIVRVCKQVTAKKVVEEKVKLTP